MKNVSFQTKKRIFKNTNVISVTRMDILKPSVSKRKQENKFSIEHQNILRTISETTCLENLHIDILRTLSEEMSIEEHLIRDHLILRRSLIRILKLTFKDPRNCGYLRIY